jgi:hypothetical protein
MHIYRAPISYIALSHGLVRSLELCTPPSPAASTTSNLDNLKHKPHCAISELTCCASGSPSDHAEISSIASWLFFCIMHEQTWRFVPGPLRLHSLYRASMTRRLWLSGFLQPRVSVYDSRKPKSSSHCGTYLTPCAAARDRHSSHWAHRQRPIVILSYNDHVDQSQILLETQHSVDLWTIGKFHQSTDFRCVKTCDSKALSREAIYNLQRGTNTSYTSDLSRKSWSYIVFKGHRSLVKLTMHLNKHVDYIIQHTGDIGVTTRPTLVVKEMRPYWHCSTALLCGYHHDACITLLSYFPISTTNWNTSAGLIWFDLIWFSQAIYPARGMSCP